MSLRKDDPVYYKDKISKLIKQAKDEGLIVQGKILDNGIQILFKADNGDTAGISLLKD